MLELLSGKEKVEITNPYGNTVCVKFDKCFKRKPVVVLTAEFLSGSELGPKMSAPIPVLMTYDVSCKGFKFIIDSPSGANFEGNKYRIHWIARGRIGKLN